RKPIHEYKLTDLGLSENMLQPTVELKELKALKVERRRQRLEGSPEELAAKLADIILEEGMARR
ncbi:MAG: hypothetical protein QXK39_01260, partial [Nitrososphaerota archaeon]